MTLDIGARKKMLRREDPRWLSTWIQEPDLLQGDAQSRREEKCFWTPPFGHVYEGGSAKVFLLGGNCLICGHYKGYNSDPGGGC